MANKSEGPNQLRCSFCGKTQDEVGKLIAGPGGVYICNECVEVCNDIIDSEFDYDEDYDYDDDDFDDFEDDFVDLDLEK